MRNGKLASLLFLVPFVPAITLSAAAGPVAGDVAAGKTLFASKCVSCHGPNGEGKDAMAKMFKVEMRPLASKEVQAKTDAQLGKDFSEGTGKMKAISGLSAADTANIVAHIRTLAKK